MLSPDFKSRVSSSARRRLQRPRSRAAAQSLLAEKQVWAEAGGPWRLVLEKRELHSGWGGNAPTSNGTGKVPRHTPRGGNGVQHQHRSSRGATDSGVGTSVGGDPDPGHQWVCAWVALCWGHLPLSGPRLRAPPVTICLASCGQTRKGSDAEHLPARKEGQPFRETVGCR